ncbi:MAG: PLDc N-terminal domain-containing protein [Acidimicrobiales bacterium]
MENVGAALGGMLILSVLLAGLVFWIWSLVDAIRVPDESAFRAGSKVVWVVVIAVTGFIGSIVYLAVGRPRPA